MASSTIPVNEVKKILILRPDNLGDLILFSGALSLIRNRYNDAEISICVKEVNINYIELCPYIDKIIVWEELYKLLRETPTLNSISEITPFKKFESLLRKITAENCRYKFQTDLLINPVRSPNMRLHIVSHLIPAKYKIGISGDYCNQSQKTDNEVKSIYTHQLKLRPDQYKDTELDVTREFLTLQVISCDEKSVWPTRWTEESDRNWADNNFKTTNTDHIILGICPGITSEVKGRAYTVNNYAAVLNLLEDRAFDAAIFGTGSEVQICNKVAQSLQQCKNVTNVNIFAGNTTIRQLVEGINKCDIILAVETAAIHLGVMLRKPTVGILGGGHFNRFYPWGDPVINRVANIQMDCYNCNWQCKYDSIRCIEDITPESIAKELKFLVENLEFKPQSG